MSKSVKVDPIFGEPMVTISVREYRQLVRNASVGENLMRLLRTKAKGYENPLSWNEIRLLDVLLNGEPDFEEG